MSSIFVLGATGYIGGAVLFELLKEISGLKATALVRNNKFEETFSKYGVTTVTGTNDDLLLITELSSKADIVLNAADADADAAVKAALDGCKRRFEETGKKSIFIHTTGIAVVLDNAGGAFKASTPVYDDRDVELLKSLPPTAWHRNVEQRVVDADEAGYVSAYNISPGSIYGESPSPIPRVALLASLYLQIARSNKGIPVIGEGSNVQNFIHIKDVASLYVTVIKHALSGKDQEVGWGKYYFATGHEYTWNSVAKAYAALLNEKGILETAEPIIVSLDKIPFGPFLSSNFRTFPGRATQLGWRAIQPSVFAEMANDLAIALKA